MIFAENFEGNIVQVLTWTKSKEEGIVYMKTLLQEKKKKALKIWAEEIKQTETF
jgi:hypothetical protein